MSRTEDAEPGGDPVELLPPRAAPPAGAADSDLTSSARIRLLWYPDRFASTSWADDLVAECGTFRDAVAMPVTKENDANNVLSGAIYTAAGELVRHSERGKSNRVWKSNAAQLMATPTSDLDRIEGRTFFAGHHRNSFGHVLLELLPRFWPDEDYGTYDNFLFYPQRAGRKGELELKTYARDLLVAATGCELPPLHIVADHPLSIAELTVSSPAFWLKQGFSPVLRNVFERVAANLTRDTAVEAEDAPRRLYLSRSRLTGMERRAENEDEIESLLGWVGFQVIHPQQLSVREQIALVRGAEVIAGCDGSALHLAAFAQPGTRLLALDSRSVPNQFLLDHLGGLDAVHVMAAAKRKQRQRVEFWRADMSRVLRALAVLELV